ncbi:MAG TPA: mechanosensitive ion channel domain-containing protein [Gammaproteobacteria bacterium]|nr:mechanosensitive ion channel domain-containing protein [Gammaproteobacteria bacterium]
MDDLFDPQRFAAIGAAIYEWLSANVLVPDNAIQLGVLVATFGVALPLSRPVAPVLAKLRAQGPLGTLVGVVEPLLLPLIWLALQLLAILVANVASWPHHLLEIGASLLSAWIAIRLVSRLVANPVWSKVIAWTVWVIAALNILNLLVPTIGVLDAAAVTIGAVRISVYTVIKAVITVAVLLSIAIYLTGVLETRIRASRALSPSVQVLFTKALKAISIVVAAWIGINSLGIDLTALAVLGGAIGLGAGFGLQRVISNMVSGVVLLLDKSIRPGDVISVSGTYGWVTALGGRYVSVVTRDGVEHMIPNETLITERVENWTHTNSHTRLKIPIRVHYETDVHQAIDICVRAACGTERVLEQPECKCLLVAFGENGLELEVRIWIGDAHNGVQNVKSEVLLKIWDMFREAGIRVPYPQRDVHVAAADGLGAGPPPGAAT